MELLKLLLRYLVSFIATGILFAVIVEIMHWEMAYFRNALFYIFAPANVVMSVLFYAVIPYIPKKARIITLIFFVGVYLFSLWTNTVGLFLSFILPLLIVHLAIPNFHDGEHYLDKKLNWWQAALFAILLLAAIIKYLFFWEDFQIII